MGCTHFILMGEKTMPDSGKEWDMEYECVKCEKIMFTAKGTGGKIGY